MTGRYDDPDYPGPAPQAPRGRHAGPPSDAFDALPDDDYRYPPPRLDSPPRRVPDGTGPMPRPGRGYPGPAAPGAAPPQPYPVPGGPPRTAVGGGAGQQPYPSGPQRAVTGPQQPYPSGPQQRFPGAPQRPQTGPQPRYPTGPQPRFPSGPQPQFPPGAAGRPPAGHPSGPQPQYPGGPGHPGGPPMGAGRYLTGPQQFQSGPQPRAQTGPQQQFGGGQEPGYPPPGFPGAGRRGPGRGVPQPPQAQEEWAEEEDESGFFSGYEEEDEPPHKKRKARRLAPWIAFFVIVLPLGALGFFGYRLYMGKYHPADYSGAGTGNVTVHVPSGATASSLGPQLLQLGVVASSRAFVLAAEHYTGTGGLEPGYFKLRLHMQASLAYEILANPKDMIQTKLTFPEGLRSANVLLMLSQKTANSLADYQAAFKDAAKLGLPSYAKGNPEGYLFPATYDIQPNQSAQQVLQTMVTKFNQEAASLHLATAAASIRLTPGQLMIVASLVQAEGGTLQDYPKVAEVVYNRIRLNMKLQFDSAVLYGLHAYGTRATDAQLKVNTPYNTYMHTGLPPTPIDNPGIAAIQAALHPASGNNYLYFCSLSQNHTEFSANPLSCP